MPVRLRREEVVAMGVMADKGEPKTRIAGVLGVTEGAVRYHLRRRAEGAEDGRRDKPFRAAALGEVIAGWMEARRGAPRPANLRELYEHLVEVHHYDGSYKSVVRYVRSRWGRPPIRTYRRVETPPGAQSQTDWGEYPRVDLGNGFEPMHAFVMTLSHSRKPAVVWSRSEDQLHWIRSHNQAFERLGGIPAVNRIDNPKTAIARGAGAWGEINPTYRTYARTVGFHIDACSPGAAQAKGKVEAKVRLSRLVVDPGDRPFDGVEHLQDWTDRRLEAWSKRAVCPATGRTVQASWEQELEYLAPLPILPEPFDVVVTRRVHRDCLVHFEGRSYAVPFVHVGRRVEIRGCAGKVQILAEGRVVRAYPRGTAQRVLLDPSCYEGEATDRVLPPPPLGRMGRKLQEILAMPVENRPIDLYAALAEVAR